MNTYNTDLETILQIAEKLAEKGIFMSENNAIICTQHIDRNEIIFYVTEKNKYLITPLTRLFHKYGFEVGYNTFKRSITVSADLTSKIINDLEKCFTEVLEDEGEPINEE